MSRYQDSLEERFKQQARQAKQRGIEWALTFEQWLSVWTESGHLAQRGKRQGQYVMGRKGDRGPYAIGNVYICTFAQNTRDARTNDPSIRIKKLGKGRGWTFLKNKKTNPYQVVVADKYIGCFGSAAEAEAAYSAACEARALHALSFAPASLSTPLNEIAEA